MFVAEEEHHRAGVVQFVHFIEVRYFRNIDQIDDCKILYFLGNAVHDLVHFHARGIPIVSETNDLN